MTLDAPELQRPHVGTIVRLALDSSVEAVRQMPLLFASAYGGLLLLAFLEPRLGYDPAASVLASHNHAPAAVLGSACAEFTIYLLRTLCLAPVAVAVHRFIIRGEITRGIVSPLPLHTQLFAFWLVVLEAVRIVMSLPGALASPSNTGGTFLALLSGVLPLALVFAGVRLSLMFPAIAIDSPGAGFFARTRISWRRSQGHGWYIFWCEFWAGLIVVAPAMLVLYALFLAGPHRTSMGIQNRLFPSLLVSELSTLAVTAIAAAAVSWIYRALIKADGAPQDASVP